MRVSAIIITKNAGATIRRCVESLHWADEIVVVDSGSTDGTPDICRELGAHVTVTSDWPGFGPQKNRALDAARGEWVFSIDADEWVLPALRDEMLAVIGGAATAPAYAMPRRSSLCGRFMRHSGWWPDYVVRLFRRDSARFSDDAVHEHVVARGGTGQLVHPLMHEAISSLDQMVGKMNAYSSAGARARRGRRLRAPMLTAVLHGIWGFLRTYVLRAGFLDGREGFILAVANAEGSYYKYVKLMYENEKAE